MSDTSNASALAYPQHETSSTVTAHDFILCRYNTAGRLERHKVPIPGTKYLAISHVWGEADWRPLEALGHEKIMATKEKAAYLDREFKDIVGDNYFWLDILCVDQRNKDERVAVTQHIPAIFRCALKTIVIRDRTAFRDCCLELLGDLSVLVDDYGPDMRRILHHFEVGHSGNEESVLTRLWVLQEVILSDTLHFVQLRGEAPRVQSPSGSLEFFPMMATIQDIIRFRDVWDDGNDGQPRHLHRVIERDRRPLAFARALLFNGTISRDRAAIKKAQHLGNLLYPQFHSDRRTSKSRDFILAIMPQYEGYIVPLTARRMTFSELYLDCCKQMAKLIPQFPLFEICSGTTLLETYPSSSNIPEPISLGDFVKLLSVRPLPLSARSPNPATGNYATLPRNEKEINVDVKPALEVVRTPYLALGIIRRQITQSQMLWKVAALGELSRSHSHESPYDACFPNQYLGCMAILKTIWIYTLDPCEKMKREQEQKILDIFVRCRAVFLQMTALISCGLGVSATEWSIENVGTVLVTVREKKYLALLSNLVLESIQKWKFGLIPAYRSYYSDEGGYALLAYCAEGDLWSFGLFPPDVNFN